MVPQDCPSAESRNVGTRKEKGRNGGRREAGGEEGGKRERGKASKLASAMWTHIPGEPKAFPKPLQEN